MTIDNHLISWGIALLSLIVIIGALFIGSVPVSIEALWISLWNTTGSAIDHDIIWSVRFPRIIAAYATGGLLAFSGHLTQTLFQNPLADSYVLGTSSGASLCMLLALLIGADTAFLPIYAGVGALGAVLIVCCCVGSLSSLHRSGKSPTALLLTGVMITAMLNAGILLVLTLLPDHAMRGMLFWIIGDLSDPEYWYIAIVVLGLAWIIARPFGQVLTILSYGMVQAKSLGVPVITAYIWVIIAIALTAGMAVSVAGPVGFIGLIAPHLCRQWIGGSFKAQLSVTIGIGGILLVIADILARMVANPIQLPVGIFTVLLGAPLFLYRLLARPQSSAFTG